MTCKKSSTSSCTSTVVSPLLQEMDNAFMDYCLKAVSTSVHEPSPKVQSVKYITPRVQIPENKTLFHLFLLAGLQNYVTV